MRLWPRALAVGAAVVVAALVLKAAPPAVVLAVFLAGFLAAALWARSKARPHDAADELLGLRREGADPFGIVGYPLSLFSRAGEPVVEDLRWGRWRSLEVHAFSLSFEPPGPSGGDRARFACAMTRTVAELPAVVCEPESFLIRLGPPPAMTRFETGDEAIDGGMDAWCLDEAAARALVDRATREWLRSLDLRWGIEVRGHVALVYAPSPDRPDVVATLDVLRGLLARLPGDLGTASAPVV